jgi:hypothetical protein
MLFVAEPYPLLVVVDKAKLCCFVMVPDGLCQGVRPLYINKTKYYVTTVSKYREGNDTFKTLHLHKFLVCSVISVCTTLVARYALKYHAKPCQILAVI